MATVERCDLSNAEALCCRDHRSIDGSQWGVSVLTNQLSDPKPVACWNRFDCALAGSEITKESDLRLNAEPGATRWTTSVITRVGTTSGPVWVRSKSSEQWW